MSNHVARRWVLGATAVLGLAFAGVAAAQAPTFFRIGTGGTAGTYFPIGGLIANAISGSEGKGVPGLVSTAVASNGSVANINAVQAGSSESGARGEAPRTS